MSRMTDDSKDADLGLLLQLAGHELRSPLSAVLGYIRMVAKGQAGPITDSQERILKEAERSGGRLKNVLDEMSLFARMKRGEEALQRSEVELGDVIEKAVADLPELADRTVEVKLQRAAEVTIQGDAPRLTVALSGLLFALRRELVGSDTLGVALTRNGQQAVIVIAPLDEVERLIDAPVDTLSSFDEHRGGCGLKLQIARWILAKHGGQVYGTGQQNRASAVIRLPVT
jgi:two-component system cell cycle sensor histidine kinase PleC